MLAKVQKYIVRKLKESRDRQRESETERGRIYAREFIAKKRKEFVEAPLILAIEYEALKDDFAEGVFEEIGAYLDD